jgi:hypothetical protein
MTLPGFEFDSPLGDPPGDLSYGRRLSIRRKRFLDAGKNPATGLEFGPEGKTCGDCWHAISKDRGFWKCELARLSNSEATDIRLSWPACTAYTATNDDTGFAPSWVTRASERKK